MCGHFELSNNSIGWIVSKIRNLNGFETQFTITIITTPNYYNDYYNANSLRLRFPLLFDLANLWLSESDANKNWETAIIIIVVFV